jgi:U3 small nucleolar RNA-associated protein 10
MPSFEILRSAADIPDHSPSLANVIDSSLFTAHLDFLLSQLSTSDSHARILAHLVLTSLLKSASGAQHVEIAVKVVESLRSIEGALQGLDIVETEQLESVVLKPNSVKTTQRVRGSLLLALQTIKAPSDVSIAWLEPSSMTAPASRFAHLAYAIYSIVNSSLAPSNLSNPLLRALFSALRDDALLFLASIYTAPPSHPETFPVELQKVALRHAEAFLKAHLNVGQGKDVVDFQTVVPSLLVALGSVERENREAALSCLKLVPEVIGSQSGVPYALDRIYGSGSG